MHRSDSEHLRGSFVSEFFVCEMVRDDANDLTASGDGSVCDGTHEADVSAAIDHADAPLS
jgi:hypothetical protein